MEIKLLNAPLKAIRSWQISKTSESYCWTFNCGFLTSSLDILDTITDEPCLEIIINSLIYKFFVEERSIIRIPAGYIVSFWGRSEHAYLGKGKAQLIIDSEQTFPKCK